MFRLIQGVLYLALPTQQKAIRLIRLVHEKKIGTAYIVAITCLFLTCFLGGLTIFVLLLIFTEMTPQRLALGTVTTFTGLGAGLLFTKAGYAIAHGNQAAQMQRYIEKGWILQIPQVCADELLPELEKRKCSHFLGHYRPDPYDVGDLTKLANEIDGEGSGSPTFIAERVAPAMHHLARKIHATMKEQEDDHSREANALNELPRPDNFEE